MLSEHIGNAEIERVPVIPASSNKEASACALHSTIAPSSSVGWRQEGFSARDMPRQIFMPSAKFATMLSMEYLSQEAIAPARKRSRLPRSQSRDDTVSAYAMGSCCDITPLTFLSRYSISGPCVSSRVV